MVVGDRDRLKLIFKAQNTSWKKGTKAIEVPGRCLVQLSNQERRTVVSGLVRLLLAQIKASVRIVSDETPHIAAIAEAHASRR